MVRERTEERRSTGRTGKQKTFKYITITVRRKYDANWKNGKKNGEHTIYDKNGNEILKQKWDFGTLVLKKTERRLINLPPAPHSYHGWK